jgi:hypothetical protein
MLIQQIVTALLLAIAPAIGLALSIMTAMVGVVGLFIGWDNIRKAVDLEYAHYREKGRAQRIVDQARFERDHPGWAGLVYVASDKIYGPREDPADKIRVIHSSDDPLPDGDEEDDDE